MVKRKSFKLASTRTVPSTSGIPSPTFPAFAGLSGVAVRVAEVMYSPLFCSFRMRRGVALQTKYACVGSTVSFVRLARQTT